MTDASGYAVRLAAVRTLTRVMEGRSLSVALSAATAQHERRDAALLSQLCYTTLRYWFSLNALLNKLMARPLKERDRDIQVLLLTGLCQLHHTRIPPHAAVDTSVRVARLLKKKWACGLVNAVLRKSMDNSDLLHQLQGDAAIGSELPLWLYQRLAASWRGQLDSLVQGMNDQGPMTLRVNTAFVSRATYAHQLEEAGIETTLCKLSPCGLQLKTATNVEELPGFLQGHVSVQDEAAQLAAMLMNCQPGERVLDACAAPGGKSCHLLESTSNLDLTAVELDPERLPRIQENLDRLRQQARVVQGDASCPADWWDGNKYDRILVDAPCSATGVIRRHPDIKLLRRAEDIQALGCLQQGMLDAVWPLLKPGGRLLYATCSVLPEENSDQVERFLSAHQDAEEQQVNMACKTPDTKHGLQLFPVSGQHDGFFYACLNKKK